MAVHALLVGIDDYPDVPLRGCLADIGHVGEFLAARVPGGVVELVLRDKRPPARR